MLAGLLPGIRELRAPLAAGYLWLAALWILFAHDVPKRGSTHAHTGIWPDVYRFIDAASVFGFAAAVSFAAYLIGTLSVAVTDWLAQPVTEESKWRPPQGIERHYRWLVLHTVQRNSTEPTTKATKWVTAQLKNYSKREQNASTRADVLKRLLEPTDIPDNLIPEAIDELDPGHPDADITNPELIAVAPLRQCVIQEFPLVTLRLLGNDPEMYGVIDRTRSEAQFRYAVALAVLVPTFTIAWRIHDWPSSALIPTLGLAGSVLLWGRGRVSERQSNSYTMHAVDLGRATPPVFDPLLRPQGKQSIASQGDARSATRLRRFFV